MKHSDQAACDCHRCNRERIRREAQPPDQEGDDMHDRPTGHAEQHRRGQQPARPVFDYDRQAWIDADGRYLRCGHPEAIDCRCWGRLHEGERAADHQPATDQPDPTRTEATQPYRTTRAAQQIARDLDHQAMTTPYRCATCRTPHARQLEADLCCPANELSQGESIDVLARELGRRLGGIL